VNSFKHHVEQKEERLAFCFMPYGNFFLYEHTLGGILLPCYYRFILLA
jgi:hypothetical protein